MSGSKPSLSIPSLCFSCDKTIKETNRVTGKSNSGETFLLTGTQDGLSEEGWRPEEASRERWEHLGSSLPGSRNCTTNSRCKTKCGRDQGTKGGLLRLDAEREEGSGRRWSYRGDQTQISSAKREALIQSARKASPW